MFPEPLSIEQTMCIIRVSNEIAQKMKVSIYDLFSKCDQIHKKLLIWSYLRKKSLMENYIVCMWCGKYIPT